MDNDTGFIRVSGVYIRKCWFSSGGNLDPVTGRFFGDGFTMVLSAKEVSRVLSAMRGKIKRVGEMEREERQRLEDRLYAEDQERIAFQAKSPYHNS